MTPTPSDSGPSVAWLVPPGAPEVDGALALDSHRHVPDRPRTPDLAGAPSSRLEHVDDTEVREWAARFAQAVVEVAAGQRPASQLVRLASRSVHRDLERRAVLVARARRSSERRRPTKPQVRSVHVSRPTPSVAEVSVHVRHGERSRAVALRLERQDGRWRCTAVEFG